MHLAFVEMSIRTQAFGHARRHELNRRTVERRASGGHLLSDSMAVASLGEHALHCLNLPFHAAKSPLNLRQRFL